MLYALCRKPGEQGYLFVVIGIGLSELFEALGQFVMSTQALLDLSSLYLWNMGSFIAVGYSTITPIAILLLLLGSVGERELLKIPAVGGPAARVLKKIHLLRR